jgi:aryl-alcohol dehydrogenase-like predicted oxidoreductase
MQTTTFGKTNLSVSRLGFGSGPVGLLPTDQQQVAHLYNFLLDQGLNLIDTGAGYGNAEQTIGQTISHRRDQYFLVSKGGGEASDLPGQPWSPKLLHAIIDRSLQRLKTDHLDAMLLHSCELSILEQGDAFNALLQARDAGKIRFAGYSGDNEAAAYAATLPETAVIETSINICDQNNIDTVLPLCAANNIAVLAKRPLANAAWKDLNEQPGFYKEYASDYTHRLRQMNIRPHELGFPDHVEIEWPEIALRFTLSIPHVHVAIVGTTSFDNARANIAAVRKGPLPEEAVNRLRRAFKRAEADAGQNWLGLT